MSCKVDWALGDFFTETDETRILGNLSTLCSNASVTIDYIPSSMSDMGIEEANNIEFTLELIELKLRGNGTLPSFASLQSSGTQYIDTGINPRTKFELEIDFEPVAQIDSTDYIAGWWNTNATDNHITIMTIDTAGQGKRVTTYYPKYLRTNQLDSLTQRFKAHLVIDTDTQKATISQGSTILAEEEKTNSVSFTEDGTLFLFADNYNNSLQYNSAIKLYSCKIWNNGELVRDYEPNVTYTENGGTYTKTPCLYDNVTQTAYYNAGTGDFIYN